MLLLGDLTILNDMEDHLNTIFVCEMAENLIYDGAYLTCGAAMVVSVAFETIFFLSYVCFRLTIAAIIILT
jgi:hypothetical protein